MRAVELFVILLSSYAALGVLFAAAFVTTGVGRVDHVAKSSGVGFRLIILPGVAALWPWLFARWIQRRRV